MDRILNDSVSCVIPTHARVEFLREAVQSVLDQTSLPLEIVVVSDVGDQATDDLCSELAASSAVPVRVIHNVNGSGASSSRNLGAADARGSLLAFLDDDDKWKPDYLRTALARLAASDADGVATWLEMFRDSSTAPGLRVRPGLPAAATASNNPGVTGSNFIVRVEAFHQLGGFDEMLPVKNDGDFFFRFLLAGHTYVVNERPDVLQRKHSSGQLTGRTEFRAAGLEAYLAKHRAHLSLKDRRFIRLSAARIRYHAATSPVAKAKQLVLGAFYSSPSTIASGVRGRSTKDFWVVQGFGSSPNP
jgi:glycosyltransferase involved in cell wall biosynthesis